MQIGRFRQGNTRPALRVIVKDSEGTLFNWGSHATAYFYMKDHQTNETFFASQATIAGTGTLVYNWRDGDLSKVGSFWAEFRVVSDLGTVSAPTKKEDFMIWVYPSLE